ncbi:Asparagine synthase [Modestobacter sp. DSM 44400]|uniref:asparagine synthase-related protein n=1 Tax=Modestobacter sp. DSM 44400 TaxID=1550230 RepID=UPI00089B0CC0|nr:asparagine synthase-related protein [Modestobacter sp. DSM 44400]SDX84079.1 Asparagine synthase [Modestobacter sp. DSM 44400]
MTARPIHGSREGGFDCRQRDQYLAFGFVPELPRDDDPLALLGDWSKAPRRSIRSVSESALVREGIRALRAAFEPCAAVTETRSDQVVFLSGGLDSRAILGGLLEVYRPAELLTATFGAPGEQDFDFAAGLARAAGVRHEVVESSSVEWTTQGLVDSVLAREVPLPHPFGQRYLSYRLHQRIGPDHTFWDGLCGGVVSGGHVPGVEERWTWEAAVAAFLTKHLLPRAERYTSPDFRPESTMPAAPFISDSLLPYPDQLDFALRQNRYIRTRFLRGHTMCSPFLARPWVDFMLALPIRYRHEQRLYMTILRRAYPRLFRLPSTTFDGAGVPASPLLRTPLVLQRRAVRKAQRLGWLPGAGSKPEQRQQRHPARPPAAGRPPGAGVGEPHRPRRPGHGGRFRRGCGAPGDGRAGDGQHHDRRAARAGTQPQGRRPAGGQRRPVVSARAVGARTARGRPGGR